MGAADQPRWLSAAEQEAWRAYLRGSRELAVALDKDLAEHGVSLPEYELISMLSEAPRGRQRMSALADFIVQSRSRVTHTAARLEKRGWVLREPAPDDGRRWRHVLLTSGRRPSARRFSPGASSPAAASGPPPPRTPAEPADDTSRRSSGVPMPAQR